VLDDYQDIARSSADWDSLPAGTEVDFLHDHIYGEDALAERLHDYEVLVCMRERTAFPGSLLRRLPNLKLLVTTGGRNAAFDMPAANELGITVSGTGLMRTPTAEMAWGLILGFCRRIGDEDRALREGRWQTHIGPSMEGKTLGIVGLGNLGGQVAAVGKCFGMDVVAWSQNLTADAAAERGARYVSREELFSTSDVISLHYVLSERSRGMIGSADFGRMKPTALFVNTSRGPIVQEQALIDALREHRIGGAALDVFDVEPLPMDHPYRSLDNVLLTPHLGYVTLDNYRLCYGEALEDVAAFLAGSPIRVTTT
jgi:phosphoglycerate dehydrogenase-like enzyme